MSKVSYHWKHLLRLLGRGFGNWNKQECDLGHPTKVFPWVLYNDLLGYLECCFKLKLSRLILGCAIRCLSVQSCILWGIEVLTISRNRSCCLSGNHHRCFFRCPKRKLQLTCSSVKKKFCRSHRSKMAWYSANIIFRETPSMQQS